MKFELKNNRNGKEIKEFLTEVEVTKTDSELIFDFVCKNSKFFSACDEYNGPVFDGDACEAFICTEEDYWYYEIEVAPNNCVFLNKIHNLGVGEYEPYPIEENFVKSQVEFLSDTDYRVKFSVPLDKINYDAKKGIKYNLFRIETEGGFTDKNLLALNPTLCDTYHKFESFIELK
ncbi:MAG: hypothetical protein E7347_06080 [Clostridiales bacterium]|nr:hypothetical protein [Clostridiales bacterium]